ncbi:MAG: CBS domain-containing protein [Alphaproteobacteria bacterium]|nr:CBS domain-containing protein [Alphaproteobacteria bacterium]
MALKEQKLYSDEQQAYLKNFQILENLIIKDPDKTFQDNLYDQRNNLSTKDYSFLMTCNSIRNILSHKEQAKFIATPQPLINELHRIVQRYTQTAYDISIKDVYFKKITDPLLPTLKDMKEKIYTHVPILDENDAFLGVLSESSIFNYIAKQEELLLDLRDLKISELADELNIDRNNESFKFVPRDMSILQLKDIFNKELESKKRLGAVFVTETGQKSEKILGIITSWDMCPF